MFDKEIKKEILDVNKELQKEIRINDILIEIANGRLIKNTKSGNEKELKKQIENIEVQQGLNRAKIELNNEVLERLNGDSTTKKST